MMKKIVLSLTGVLAATAFAPEASALPAFARQTGMACTACHAQHFPVLNGFGRAFKASGYTLMGAQGRVEGEHLSIPDTMNAALLLKYRYAKDSGPASAAGAGQTAKTSRADGQWQMGDEFSLFFGGRIAESDNIKIGFLNENGGMAVTGLRVPIVYDAGAVQISAVPFTTDMLGVAYGYEQSSGGIQRANRWSEQRRETSAVQYNADQGAIGGDNSGAASGHAFVVANDMFFVNYTIWSSSFLPGGLAQSINSTNYGQKYIRVAVTPSFEGWDFVAGFGKESGTSYSNIGQLFAPASLITQAESKQTFIDVQAQGEIAGMETGIWLQNAKAPACTTTLAAGVNCVHNNGAFERKATTIGAEVSVIPHTLSLGLAYRNAKNGSDPALNRDGDNAIKLAAVYELFQNVALHADYAKYSGNAHNKTGDVTSQYILMLESAW